MEELAAQRQLAEDRGLAFFVFGGDLFIMDSGARAARGDEGWFNEMGCSSRSATPEECDLWRALGGC
jgi:hypothetical protein